MDQHRHRSAIAIGAILLLIGAMGSAADAVIHLVAYEMTAPDATPAPLFPVMARLQGPDLILISSMLLGFFVGSLILAIGFARAGLTTIWNPLLFIAAVAVGIVGSRLLGADPNGQRTVGLTVLGLISVSQVWLGLALRKSKEVLASGGNTSRTGDNVLRIPTK